MAEALGVFYAVETVVEGAVVAALAVSGGTVPLHARFQKINSPSPSLTLKGSTASVVKNKIYLFGGQAGRDHVEHGVHVLSFPPDFGASRTDGSPINDLDYKLYPPELMSSNRPLEQHNDNLSRASSTEKYSSRHSSWSRTKHALATINDRIYILGGVDATNSTSRRSNSRSIMPLDTVLMFDTLKNSYVLISADPQKCTEGIPEARYSASCTSSPYPLPIAAAEGQGPSIDAHGTIFMHGGCDVAGAPLHDTWTFDVGTRAWHKFPSIVETTLPDRSMPGSVTYVDHRLWYVNGSTVMHLDLAEHDPKNNDAASQDPSTLSIGRVGSGQWQVVYPPPAVDPSAPAQSKDVIEAESKKDLPSEPTSHIISVTTGAGRVYLVHLSSRNPGSLHTFQIPSSPKTAASLKDTIRDKATAIANLSEKWKSGKYEWSKVKIVQKMSDKGPSEIPAEELEDFTACPWEEYGDKFIIWGGHEDAAGAKNEGWVVNLE